VSTLTLQFYTALLLAIALIGKGILVRRRGDVLEYSSTLRTCLFPKEIAALAANFFHPFFNRRCTVQASFSKVDFAKVRSLNSMYEYAILSLAVSFFVFVVNIL